MIKEFNYTINTISKSLSLKQYIYRIGSYHFNWHQPIELLVVLNGEVEVCTNGFCKILKTDDVILINSNSGHATLAHEPNSIVMLFHIDPIFFNKYYKNAELLQFEICSTGETRNFTPFSLIRLYLSEMILSFNNKAPDSKLLFESKFYSLMHTIIKYFPPKEIQSADFARDQKKKTAIEKMLKYIDNNYEKKITLSVLAKECGYNSNYVSQIFKTNIGINFHEYLTRIRLREATRDLSNTDHKILDIALENGFSDIKSFNAAFKNNFGKSPTEYRKKLNNEIAQVDVSFKKEFVLVDDILVNNKLNEYVLINSCVYNSEKNNLYSMEKAYKLKAQFMYLKEKFMDITENINDVIDNIDSHD